MQERKPTVKEARSVLRINGGELKNHLQPVMGSSVGADVLPNNNSRTYFCGRQKICPAVAMLRGRAAPLVRESTSREQPLRRRWY